MQQISPTTSPRLHGKVSIITGAAQGIGLATALKFAQEGAIVIVCDVKQATVDDAVKKCHDLGAEAQGFMVDVTQRDMVDATVKAVLDKFGRIDVLVNNAGITQDARLQKMTLEQFDRVIDVNLRGVFNCLDAVLPTLLAQGSGGIGVVSSVAGYSGLPKALVYGPTKAALINLCESLYFDLHPRGNAVYLINPGFVETPATAGNQFAMPALMPAADAAKEILRGMENGRFHIHFPRRFTNWLRLARLLPYRWYFALIHKVTGL